MLIIWFGTLINFYNYLHSSSLKYLLCIFPNLGLLFGFEIMLQFERSGRDLNFESLFINIFNDPLNLGSIMICMNLWSVFYIIMTWYFEKILPSEYGVPLPFYFLFTKSYWFPQAYDINKYDSNYFNGKNINKPSFEMDPQGYRNTVCVQNLSKEFLRFKTVKKAVNNVSINFYENQIYGLLGKNGAGKTTTTFLLCGLYPPTSGTTKIMGYDLRTNIDHIRSLIGYCPQVDILFDNFNVEEHLKLVALVIFKTICFY